MSRKIDPTVRLQVLDRETGEGQEWTEPLEIDGQVDIDDNFEPNKAEISIWNLSPTSRSFIEGGEEDFDRVVRLFAGWEGQDELIFQGDVTETEDMAPGGDQEFVIKSGDGQKAFNQARINQSFKGQQSQKKLLEKVAGKMSEDVSISDRIKDAVQSSGAFLSGRASDETERLAKSLGANVSIQQGSIEVTPADGALNEEIIELSSDSGLIGYPEKTSDGKKMTALLEPRLLPRRFLKLDTIRRNMAGIYLIYKVKHRVNNNGGYFFTDVEGERRG